MLDGAKISRFAPPLKCARIFCTGASGARSAPAPGRSKFRGTASVSDIIHFLAGPLLMACALISAFCVGVLLGLGVHERARRSAYLSDREGMPR